MTRSRRATKSATEKRSAKPRAKALKPSPDRGRQIARQLSVLRLLEGARRGLTIAELHRAILEQGIDRCTERTIYRDIEQLQHAGFQLIDLENSGRWSVQGAGPSLKSQQLRDSELLSLLVSEDLLTPENSGALGVSLRDLRGRLMAQLTPKGRAFVQELRGSNVATYAAPLRPVSDDRISRAIDDAVGREHCLRLTYATPGKPASERVVEPHLFWVHQGRPYLAAYCRSTSSFRKFALQRVKAAEVLDEAFERRPDFDATAFVQKGFGMLHGDTHEFRIEFSAEVAHLAKERVWHQSQQIIANTNGTALLEMTAAGLPEVAAWVASFGGKARAVAPEALVGAVRELHERGLKAHQPQKRRGRSGDRRQLTLDVKGYG